jgi:hypothetical protein
LGSARPGLSQKGGLPSRLHRVSTTKQGRSGLGVEAQRQAVTNYLNGGTWRIVAEFTEVESGRRSDRPALDKALAAARVHQVPLVVAKVDRLTRSVAFLSRLLEAGVDVRFSDLPQIEGPSGRFMLQQMAAGTPGCGAFIRREPGYDLSATGVTRRYSGRSHNANTNTDKVSPRQTQGSINSARSAGRHA